MSESAFFKKFTWPEKSKKKWLQNKSPKSPMVYVLCMYINNVLFKQHFVCMLICIDISGGTLLWDNRRLIGRSLMVLARKVQNNRD